MFGFGNPKKKLEKEYERIMKRAVDAQRNGDMALFAKLSSDADKVLKKIDEIEDKK